MISKNSQSFSFIGYRKHFLKDRRYYIQVCDKKIIMSEHESMLKPKYDIPINIQNQIGWLVINNKIEAFEYFYGKKQKYIHANSEDLEILKQRLQGRVLFYSINDFYLPQDVLGVGSFASVVICRQKQTGKNYAVKAIKKDMVEKQAEEFASFKNEVLVMKHLTQLQQNSKNHVVNLHEIYHGKTAYYLVMDQMEGNSLQSEIEKLARQLVPQKEIAKTIMRQLLEGVQFIHDAGVRQSLQPQLIHRDLKPENLMFHTANDYESLRIIDFGLATYSDIPIYQYPTCGTPGYVAPEVLNSKEKYGKLVDIFSCGCIFYQLLTGKRLFEEKNIKRMIRANKKCVINFDTFELRQLDPTDFDLLKLMLTRNPNKRPSALECLQHPYFIEGDLQKMRSISEINPSQSGRRSTFDQIALDLDQAQIREMNIKEFPLFRRPSLLAPLQTNVDPEPEGILDQVQESIMQYDSCMLKSFYMKDPLSVRKKAECNMNSGYSLDQNGTGSEELVQQQQYQSFSKKQQSSFSPMRREGRKLVGNSPLMRHLAAENIETTNLNLEASPFQREIKLIDRNSSINRIQSRFLLPKK